MTPAHRTRLHLIAAALRIQPEAFSHDLHSGEVGETLSLLRFWSAIADSQGRRRVLTLARQEARRSGHSDEACACCA